MKVAVENASAVKKAMHSTDGTEVGASSIVFVVVVFNFSLVCSFRLFNAISSLSNVSYETRFVIIVYTKLVLLFFSL